MRTSGRETVISHAFAAGIRSVTVRSEGPTTVVITDLQGVRHTFVSMSVTPTRSARSAIATALGALWTIGLASLLALVWKPSKLWSLTTESESGPETN
jgi:hypothetical protein